MGSNSNDALSAFMKDYLSRCRVVGDKILSPDEVAQDFDPTAGGHRLPTAPPVDQFKDVYKRGEHCLFCGTPGGHGGLQCPDLCATAGRPDYKRGQ